MSQETMKVSSVVVKNMNTAEEKNLAAGGVFVAIGHEPNTDIFKGQVDLDEKGYVIVQNGTKTNIDGVFAAGDVHDFKYRQAITAAGFGCMAALDIEKWLSEKREIKKSSYLYFYTIVDNNGLMLSDCCYWYASFGKKPIVFQVIFKFIVCKY